MDAEELIKKSNIPWGIVRAPVIYGPHQPAVLNRFFLDALYKKKIYIIGDGNNLRSLCFIDNLIEGLRLLSEKRDIEGKTYILSDSSSYTFNGIIETVSSVTKYRIKIKHLPNIVGDISSRIHNLMDRLFNLYFTELYALKTMQINLGCDITKAKTEIGYNPTVTLGVGIKHTVEWIKGNFSKEH